MTPKTTTNLPTGPLFVTDHGVLSVDQDSAAYVLTAELGAVSADELSLLLAAMPGAVTALRVESVGDHVPGAVMRITLA